MTIIYTYKERVFKRPMNELCFFLIKDKRRDEDYDEDVEETLLDEVTFLLGRLQCSGMLEIFVELQC